MSTEEQQLTVDQYLYAHIAYRHNNDLKMALATIVAAYQLRPERADLAVAVANSMLDAGFVAEALKFCERKMAEFSTEPMFWSVAAMAAERLQAKSKARQYVWEFDQMIQSHFAQQPANA